LSDASGRRDAVPGCPSGGERNIAVGIVVGSTVINVLAILGISGLASSGGLPVSAGNLRLELPVTSVAGSATPDPGGAPTR
jgi:Ca2+/Na+ antiporter